MRRWSQDANPGLTPNPHSFHLGTTLPNLWKYLPEGSKQVSSWFPRFKRGEFNTEHIWVTTRITPILGGTTQHGLSSKRLKEGSSNWDYEDSKGDTGQSKGLRIKSRGAASAWRWKQRPWEHPQARHSQSSQGRYSSHYTRVQGQGGIWENLWPSPGHLPCCCCSVSKLCLGVNQVTSVVSNSLQSHGLWSSRLLCPWDSPGKNPGVGCPVLLQGIFPTRDQTCISCGSSLQAESSPLSHLGSPAS